jgi:hypothetical protein
MPLPILAYIPVIPIKADAKLKGIYWSARTHV